MGSSILRRQRGFTIVELLIVIVVIGILAAIVITSFSGVQAKARDTERQTDVKSLASQLEAFYNSTGTGTSNGNGKYPASGTTAGAYLYSSVLTSANIKGLDAGALSAPGQTTTITTAPASSAIDTAPTGLTKDQYMYLGATSAGALCTDSANGCDRFQIWYKNESGAAANVSKTSLN